MKFLTQCVKRAWYDELGSAHRCRNEPLVDGPGAERRETETAEFSNHVDTRIDFEAMLGELSGRDLHVLLDLLSGGTDKQSAAALGLSEGAARKLRRHVRSWIDSIVD